MDRHPATVNLLSWFVFDHLRPGLPRDVSAQCAGWAQDAVAALPDGPELTTGLRKLLEAKDCLVRAAIEAGRASST